MELEREEIFKTRLRNRQNAEKLTQKIGKMRKVVVKSRNNMQKVTWESRTFILKVVRKSRNNVQKVP